ncbi:ribonucleoside triphosphate reductase [Heterostelium album PN500]|uniref:ribonucleoside-triphosphate reductase (thioredoxin) n=1 Tax=Heterostelium pallidum (strain ATCC 26659 / Pp 5 / PN500) TaxID=670386 RepID=D3B159_HETP5|nr:ribonucleoside triphosphate reductase [Heterostelium album PN500]EFA85033.1 ribonucleoside triphosphate reductase [Heterostelium album PN500]|eukprot:XP_020437143.1 ribonucleoside triphosphate reductase [Heterostelium album PN500]
MLRSTIISKKNNYNCLKTIIGCKQSVATFPQTSSSSINTNSCINSNLNYSGIKSIKTVNNSQSNSLNSYYFNSLMISINQSRSLRLYSTSSSSTSSYVNNNNNNNNEMELNENRDGTTSTYGFSSSSSDVPHEPTPFLYEDVKHQQSGLDRKFRLSNNFVETYRKREAPFGFGVLGELVYRRTYSRLKPDGTNEQWFETVERVVNGTFNMQRDWIEKHGLIWNASTAQHSAQQMYERIFSMKFLPPGRGLWAMGSPLTEEKGLYAALNNCAFVSTEHMKRFPAKPFIFLMDASMLGVGVGFDTKGAGTMIVKGPKDRLSSSSKPQIFVIPDCREGWVESVRLLLDTYFLGKSRVEFDYSQIRPSGTPIKGFGGHSSGPDSLKLLHRSLSETLDKEVGKYISVTTIVDLMNHIGKCVVSANTRQTAEIAFGDPHSTEYINLKNYKVNPHRADFGWTSNNSVFAQLGMDYQAISERIIDNGEPGFAWLQNMQRFSRMDAVEGDNKDSRAVGGNPCLEQTLESFEVCCLVETFPNNHDSLQDYLETLKYAFLYAKTVTLGKTQWPDTNRVLLRNRRIGCSMSGIAQFITSKGLDQLKHWSTEGYKAIQQYDNHYSEWLAIPKSIKTTSIKPSGTVSLLAGATPGMHYPISEYYIRRVRLQRDSPLLKPLIEAGYHVEPAVENKYNMVVEIPIHSGQGIRKAKSLTMWEQLSLAAFLQKYWADNQVSCTVSFNPATEGSQLPYALDYFQYQLKGVSFLPVAEGSEQTYAQMPYEEIDADTYQKMIKNLKPVSFNAEDIVPTEPSPDKFCDSSSCQVLSPAPPSPENLS